MLDSRPCLEFFSISPTGLHTWVHARTSLKYHRYQPFNVEGISSSLPFVSRRPCSKFTVTMKIKTRTILLACSALAFRYAAAGTIPPDLDLENFPDPMLDPGMLGSLAAHGAKTHAATCRWTNCGQNCPAGFVEVPRNQGEEGEVISEHTQCGGHGRSNFCCPPHPDMTKCYWRGFSDSGKCTPGCEIRKNNRGVEVGTTKAGCTKSGYQSVCCTTPQSREATTSVFSYYQCGWFSAGKFPKNEKREQCAEPGKSFDCPADRPNFVTSSNLSFGGEVECLEGKWPNTSFLSAMFILDRTQKLLLCEIHAFCLQDLFMAAILPG